MAEEVNGTTDSDSVNQNPLRLSASATATNIPTNGSVTLPNGDRQSQTIGKSLLFF